MERGGNGTAISSNLRTSGTVRSAKSAGGGCFPRLNSHRCQPGVGQNRKRDMAMPTVPVSHLILVQTGFALGFLDALFDCVASGSHSSPIGQGSLSRRIGEVARQFVRLTDRTPKEQPTFTPRPSLIMLPGSHGDPIIGTRPLFTFRHGQTLPFMVSQGSLRCRHQHPGPVLLMFEPS